MSLVLRQALPQCNSINMGVLVKSRRTFTRSINVVIFVNDFVLVVTLGLHNLFSLSHTDFTISSACRFRTLDSFSLPNYFDRDKLFEFCLDLVAVSTVSTLFGKVLGE